MTEKDIEIDKKGREVALQLEQLLGIVDFDYNRHHRCIVCNAKFLRHEDGLPCEDDENRKRLRWQDRWGNIRYN
tara:strand:- start:219 stop:440 length:222 start_codon:yes stop_codon:yes gene_type:complete